MITSSHHIICVHAARRFGEESVSGGMGGLSGRWCGLESPILPLVSLNQSYIYSMEEFV